MNRTTTIKDITCLYFIGIGGIGMSGLARYFNGENIEVHGYDRISTPLTKALESEGMIIHYKEDVTAIPAHVDFVIYTPAVPATHKELVSFREKGIEIYKRAEVLGWLSGQKRTLAVAGTHGKTSTTTILAHLLRQGGVDCTAFLGGIAANYGTNFLKGEGEWLVAEADEFDRSFLKLHPEYAAILSMDADHLDIYGNEDSITKGYQDFGALVDKENLLVNVAFAKYFDEEIKTFGIEEGNIQAKNIKINNGWYLFDIEGLGMELKGLKFGFPGRHNVMNALVAAYFSKQAGLSDASIKNGLESFAGVKRRFEYIVREDGNVYIDDYAHHPTELKAAIGAVREIFPENRLTGIFQPHLFSRTQDFAQGFSEALSELDELWLMDIYPARELPIPGVSSQLIFDKVKNTKKALLTAEQILAKVENERPELLITLGAGDIDKLVPKIEETLKSIVKN